MPWQAMAAILLCLFFIYLILKRGKEKIKESADILLEKARNERRVLDYFKKCDETRRLSEYAKEIGCSFAIQDPKKELDNFRAGSLIWEFAVVKRGNKYENLIIVPLDALELAEYEIGLKYGFLSKNLEEILEKITGAVVGEEGIKILEILNDYTLKLKVEIKNDAEEWKIHLLSCLSHEIGHWKLAEENRRIDFERCFLARLHKHFHGCFFDELAASLRGLDILSELNLLEAGKRDYFLKEARKIAEFQCLYCLSVKKTGKCFFKPGNRGNSQRISGGGKIMKETIRFIENKERKKKFESWLKEGYRARCVCCGRVYKNTPQKWYEDGHGGRYIVMCRCGSDLFKDLSEVIAHQCKTVEVKPVNGTLVFKEHHFKYCKCEKGEVWTGKAEFECNAEFKLEFLKKDADKKVFRCPKSGLKIVILKSTSQELKGPDEMGSTYLRLP